MEIQNSFLTTLLDIRSGKCLNELSEQLARLIGEVRHTGKGGALHFKLGIKPLPGDATRVFVTDEVSLKSPVMTKPLTIFYPTEENKLSRKDPNQAELNLRPVPDAEDENGDPINDPRAIPGTEQEAIIQKVS